VSQPDESTFIARARGQTRSKLNERKIEIERLPDDEYAELVRCLSEKDWKRWDKEIELTLRSTNETSWYVRHATQRHLIKAGGVFSHA